jgi:hypothetical protein
MKMKNILVKTGLMILVGTFCSFSEAPVTDDAPVYHVGKLKKPMKIDADWNKAQWKNVRSINITNYMGTVPEFKPETQVKMLYDNDYVYVIFHVKDRYVKCITDRINGPVWQDSAVEFFFAPDPRLPLLYFNLETNCGGTPLLSYNLVPRKESKRIDLDDIKKVEIASTLPKIIDPEISNPVEWTLEYRIPLDVLEKYSNAARPQKGVEWKANFYKIAEITSNPHYITWAEVINEKPDFHRPEFFGRLIFD